MSPPIGITRCMRTTFENTYRLYSHHPHLSIHPTSKASCISVFVLLSNGSWIALWQVVQLSSVLILFARLVFTLLDYADKVRNGSTDWPWSVFCCVCSCRCMPTLVAISSIRKWWDSIFTLMFQMKFPARRCRREKRSDVLCIKLWSAKVDKNRYYPSISGLVCRSAVSYVDQRSCMAISGLVCQSALFQLSISCLACLSISGLVRRSAVLYIDQRSRTSISGLVRRSALDHSQCECTMWVCH